MADKNLNFTKAGSAGLSPGELTKVSLSTNVSDNVSKPSVNVSGTSCHVAAKNKLKNKTAKKRDKGKSIKPKSTTVQK